MAGHSCGSPPPIAAITHSLASRGTSASRRCTRSATTTKCGRTIRWTLGAYGSFNPPGVITGLGALLEESVGPIHFAGADFSPTWSGYMDGAIGSGEQAAKAVAHQLSR